MGQITVTLPDSAAAELLAASREANRHPEEIASEALQRVLLLRRFDRAQEKVSKLLRFDGLCSEPDALDEIS